ncbi:MAG: tRNA-intron lyase [Candidatus Ranarchaeia archaeon]|jgi:tRNA-intron endonuclease
MDPNPSTEGENNIPVGVMRGKKILFSLNEAQSLYNQGMFGSILKGGKLALDPFEAGILLERRRIQITKDQDETSYYTIQEFLEFFGLKDKSFWGKYLVYKDLKDRGYPVKPGLGDLIDFRVYPRGGRPGDSAAKYFIHIVTEGLPTSVSKLYDAISYSKRNKRNLILAIGDRSGDIVYYQVTNLDLSKKI